MFLYMHVCLWCSLWPICCSCVPITAVASALSHVLDTEERRKSHLCRKQRLSAETISLWRPGQTHPEYMNAALHFTWVLRKVGTDSHHFTSSSHTSVLLLWSLAYSINQPTLNHILFLLFWNGKILEEAFCLSSNFTQTLSFSIKYFASFSIRQAMG